MSECASWQECLDSYSVIKVTTNKAKARSLLETAEARVSFYENNTCTEDNANFLFEGYYNSILEVIHSLVVVDGFKVENHVYLGYYLRDFLKRPELFRLFDDCRYKRNSLIYYGRRMNFETAKETINKIKILLEELKKIVKKRGRNE